MARLLSTDGTPDDALDPEEIADLSRAEAFAVLEERYGEHEWLIDVVSVDADGDMTIAMASPHDGLVYETRLTS